MAAFNQSLKTMASLGATIVDPADLPSTNEIRASNNETVVLAVDFKVKLFLDCINHINAEDSFRLS